MDEGLTVHPVAQDPDKMRLDLGVRPDVAGIEICSQPAVETHDARSLDTLEIAPTAQELVFESHPVTVDEDTPDPDEHMLDASGLIEQECLLGRRAQPFVKGVSEDATTAIKPATPCWLQERPCPRRIEEDSQVRAVCR